MGTSSARARTCCSAWRCRSCVTLAMGVALRPWMMAGLVAVNGLAQATGWSGNVGTMAGWFHKHERGRVMGVWSTNFTVGAIASGFSMAGCSAITSPASRSRGGGASTSAPPCSSLVWVQFYFFQRNRPEDVGLPPIDDPATAVDESQDVAEQIQAVARRVDEPPHRRRLLLLREVHPLRDVVVVGVLPRENYKLSRQDGERLLDRVRRCAASPACSSPAGSPTTTSAAGAAASRSIMMIGMMRRDRAADGVRRHERDRCSRPARRRRLHAVRPRRAALSGAGAMDIGSRHAATFATARDRDVRRASGPVVQELVIAARLRRRRPGLGPISPCCSAARRRRHCSALALVLRETGEAARESDYRLGRVVGRDPSILIVHPDRKTQRTVQRDPRRHRLSRRHRR